MLNKKDLVEIRKILDTQIEGGLPTIVLNQSSFEKLLATAEKAVDSEATTIGPPPVNNMSAKDAMEIIRAGLVWANWTDEQKEAMKYAYVAISKTDTYTTALQKIGNSSGELGQLAKFMPKIARDALDTFGEKHRFAEEETDPDEAVIKEWTHQLGYDKATLIKLGYPHDMVLMMTEEDVTSELEAIQ